MKNFDVFAAIDWSGARIPVKTRSIALSVCQKGSSAPDVDDAPLSRTKIAAWIERQSDKTERTLVGIDCNFGYAQDIGIKQFGKDYTYLDVWGAVEDSSASLQNYHAGGFWQHPDHTAYFWQQGSRPITFNADTVQRETEKRCAAQGYGHPESPFKLIGAKQVGKGGLAGMRLVYDLKRRCGPRICVWPFEQETSETRLIIVEIYPRLFLKRAGLGNRKARDGETLNKALSFFESDSVSRELSLNDHISDAIISSVGLRYLAGTGATLDQSLIQPQGMTKEIASREGWIFGV